MANEKYLDALNSARSEMARIIGERAGLDVRLTQLKSTIDALSQLVHEVPKAEVDIAMEMAEEVGISQAIRKVLKESQTPLTPGQVKTKLTDTGLDLAKYANPGSVIYNTLKRLERQGEISAINDPSGAFAYSLQPSNLELLNRLMHEHPVEQAKRGPITPPPTILVSPRSTGLEPPPKPGGER